MATKRDIWNQITGSLESKLSKSEFKTWFSHTTLTELDDDLATIRVPNKFVANWIRDQYKGEIKKAFKKTIKVSPNIHFSFDNHIIPQETSEKRQTDKSNPYLNLKGSINSSMTFNDFIKGESNRFAFSLASEVANNPSSRYNPLFIFAKMGLGKTHLLNAIANHVLSLEPSAKVGYISPELIISDFTDSSKNRNFSGFKEKYNNLDLLLLDDLQQLGNRKRIQEELLSIFNTLHNKNKRIVISGDSAPSRFRNINSQLVSRIGWGLLAEIQIPDQKTKINIIKKRAKEDNIAIPDDIISFLAKSNSDIKTIIKNVVRLETFISLNKGDINISTVKSLLKDKNRNGVGIEEVHSITAGFFNISISELISNKKKRIYSFPRHLAMYLCRKYTDLSYQEIGYSFGNRDHSSVIYAIRRIEKLREQKKDVQDTLNKIENILT